MCQCLPVKKFVVRIAPVSFLLALISSLVAGSAQAQSNVGLNSVTTINHRDSRSSIELITERKTALSRPIMQYLKDDDGTTTLVVDFPGLLWRFPTKVIHVAAARGTTSNTSHRGIEMIRVGRFQESPPVCRIAIVSHEAAALKSVSFKASPGKLTVGWSQGASSKEGARSESARRVDPPVAPPIAMSSRVIDSSTSRFNMPSTTRLAPEVGSRRLASGDIYPTAPAGAEQETVPRRAPQRKVVAKPQVKAAGTSAPARESIATEAADEKSAAETAPRTAPPIRSATSSEDKNDRRVAGKTVDKTTQNKRKPGLFGSLLSRLKRKDEAETTNSANQKEIVAAGSTGGADDAPPRVAPDRLTPSRLATEPIAKMFPGTTQVAAANADRSKIPSSPPPGVKLIEGEDGEYRISINSHSGEDLNFSTFRLHNPERFVIDFENLLSLAEANIPQPNATSRPLLKALRAGSPDKNRGIGRLVLDLEGPQVSVIPTETARTDIVTFAIANMDNPLANLTAPPGSTIVLDAGHGGTDPGAQRGSIDEKDLTLAIVKETERLLKQSGVKVTLTRDSDSTVTLAERVEITNKKSPDLFLSVHINSLQSTSDIHGIETYYQTPQSKALAQAIHDSLVTGLEAPDRKIRTARFYVINRTSVPAVLAEVGFISHKQERDKLASADYQKKVAGALAKGVVMYIKQHASLADRHLSKQSDETTRSPSRTTGSESPDIKTLSNAKTGNVKPDKPEASDSRRAPSAASRLAGKGLGIHPH